MTNTARTLRAAQRTHTAVRIHTATEDVTGTPHDVCFKSVWLLTRAPATDRFIQLSNILSCVPA